ncbi:hypothetical protein HHI36_008641 [Cryptolaemus montrouzieri]|uniref:Uncharacterized protein n=1 Tax=Cryptolaemus montrouzieri TaxID=559131 RepID=A0ABD2MTL5_9CUCU
MLRQEVDEEDLRMEIFSLRKHIARVCTENQVLKVKIRKLQDEMIRRDRQLDEFLHSRRFFGFTKNVQDKGASGFLNLKLKTDKLEQILLEKDITIKRLQNTLQTAKLYNANSLCKKYASKGTECTLITDNKLEFHKKSKLNTKIELHMPNFNKDCFNELEENTEEEIKVNKRNANSVESQFLLDINFDLKQSSKPSYHSGARYARSASYQMETRESKSEGSLERRKIVKNSSPLEEHAVEDNFRARGQYQFHENFVGEKSPMNPAFRKILETVEELMSQGITGANIFKKLSVDECVQFPVEEQILNGQSEEFSISRIEEELEISRKEMDTIENEESPMMLEEMQILDTFNEDTQSISEKTDKMEKVEKQGKTEGDSPHEEIKQLHVYLMDMITQVDNLKDTIYQMKADQERTENDLKFKDKSIERLAREIQHLRELKTISSVDLDQYPNQIKACVESVENAANVMSTYETIQEATEKNIKKIAGKMKILKDSKSKSSISSQTLEKRSSKTSSKYKPEKRKSSEKSSTKKSEVSDHYSKIAVKGLLLSFWCFALYKSKGVQQIFFHLKELTLPN